MINIYSNLQRASRQNIFYMVWTQGHETRPSVHGTTKEAQNKRRKSTKHYKKTRLEKDEESSESVHIGMKEKKEKNSGGKMTVPSTEHCLCSKAKSGGRSEFKVYGKN